MINLIDNTTLHHFEDYFDFKKTSKNYITISELFEILSFAEFIMFSDEIRVSSFARIDINSKSQHVLALLQDYKVSSDIGGNIQLFDFISYNEADYKGACDSAVEFICNSLDLLNIEDLKELSKLSIKKSKVKEDLKVKKQSKDLNIRLVEFLKRDFDDNERQEIVEYALDYKAMGAYAYIICKSKNIYDKVRIYGRICKEKDLEKLRDSLEILFRIHINEHLSLKNINSFYTPAPKRAEFKIATEDIIKQQKEAYIVDLKKRIQNSKLNDDDNNYLRTISSNYGLPIPIFAIHYLTNEYLKNPKSSQSGSIYKLLDYAMDLRMINNSIVDLRNDINHFQKLRNSLQSSDQQKVDNQLKKMEYFCLNPLNSWTKFVKTI